VKERLPQIFFGGFGLKKVLRSFSKITYFFFKVGLD